MREALTRSPPRLTVSRLSTTNLRSETACRSRARSPLRSFPKRKSTPTYSSCTPRVPMRNSSTKRSASTWAISWLKGMNRRRSIPCAARISTFCWRVRIVRGALSGRRILRGWGSKATASASIRSARARSRTFSRILWCPRWTPSKFPMVATHARGAFFSPRKPLRTLTRSASPGTPREQRQPQQQVRPESSGQIVGHDPPAAGKPFELPGGEGFQDVGQPEEEEPSGEPCDREGDECHRHEETRHLVRHRLGGILDTAARLASIASPDRDHDSQHGPAGVEPCRARPGEQQIDRHRRQGPEGARGERDAPHSSHGGDGEPQRASGR